MKNVYRIFILSLFLLPQLKAQPEFGAIGSYWTYGYSPHDGNGNGWAQIVVEGDTVINGETYKILKRSSQWAQTLPPFDGSYGTFWHTMLLRNDSVFIDEKLVLDFDMTLADSLIVTSVNGFMDLQLAVDSITTVQIDGVDYKKWYGQKICIDGVEPGPYESFEILEYIGQLWGEYLFWNTDGCITGGGSYGFTCYKNGDFTYPTGADCPVLMIVDVEEPGLDSELTVYPNPVEGILHLKAELAKLQRVSITDLSGKSVLEINNQNGIHQIDLNALKSGMYLLKVTARGGEAVRKVVKL